MAPARHAPNTGRHRPARRRSLRVAYTCLLVLSVLGLTAVGGVRLLSAAEPERDTVSPDAPARPPTPEASGGSSPPAGRALETADAGPKHAAVRVDARGDLSWALLDRRTGELTGSANLAESGVALGLVAPWLAADHLRRAEERGGGRPTDRRMRQLRAIVRGTDAYAADALSYELGGPAAIRRLVRVCGLTDSRPDRGYWAGTVVSARDVARLGLCLADGRAAGRRWTAWLLDELRAVKAPDDFGVRRALPAAEAATVAVRNGWQLRAGRWHVNCLAITRDWVIGVMTRYPERLGLPHGKALCRDVGGQLVAR